MLKRRDEAVQLGIRGKRMIRGKQTTRRRRMRDGAKKEKQRERKESK